GPEDFASAGGPATEVRGLTAPTTSSQAVAETTEPAQAREAEPLPELGTPGQHTMLRAMPVLPADTTPRSTPATPDPHRWRLRGPFLEVLPGAGAGEACPDVQWQGGVGQPNVRSVTGIDVPCGWSVDAQPVEAQGSVTATATVPLALPAGDPTAALQQWLSAA